MLSNPFRINKGLLALATLSAVLLLGTPQSANATLAIYLQEDAGPIVLVNSTTDFNPAGVTFSGTFGPTGVGGTDFQVTVQSGSSDNGANASDLLAATNAITNLSSATHTLHVWASQNNYTLPPGTPLNVESGLGGSVTTATLTFTNIFQAYADRLNNLLGTPAAGPAIADFTNGPQTAIPTGSTFDTGSAVGQFARTDNNLYSLTSVANIQLTAGARINFSDHIRVTPVPEPATIGMAVSSLPILGLLWARRRRQRA
jgi:hypothetical protein